MKRIWLFFFCGIAGLLFLMCSACNDPNDPNAAATTDSPQSRYTQFFLSTPSPTETTVYRNAAGAAAGDYSMSTPTPSQPPSYPDPNNPSVTITPAPVPQPCTTYTITAPTEVNLNIGAAAEEPASGATTPSVNAGGLIQQIMTDPQSTVRVLRDASTGNKFRGILASAYAPTLPGTFIADPAADPGIQLNNAVIIGGIYTAGTLKLINGCRITEDSLYIRDAKNYNSTRGVDLLELGFANYGLLRLYNLPYREQITQYREVALPPAYRSCASDFDQISANIVNISQSNDK